MRNERVDFADLYEAARTEGISDLRDVDWCVLEADGHFSFLRRRRPPVLSSAAEAVEEVAGDLLDLRVAAGQAVGPVGAARGDDGAAGRRGVGAEHGVAVGDALDVASGRATSNSREAMNSISDGSLGAGGRVAVVAGEVGGGRGAEDLEVGRRAVVAGGVRAGRRGR